jgi:RNA recognition motif-containing protein
VGYGFVLYDSGEACEKAISSTNGQEWKGKKLYTGPFIKNKPKKAAAFNNIYVRNIPKEWSEEKIKSHFSKYGEFGSVMIREPDSKSLDKLPDEKKKHILAHKYAFICYKNFDSAKNAVNFEPYYKLNNKEYNSNIEKLADLAKKNGIEDE